MQTNCNLVIYGDDDHVYWESNTEYDDDERDVCPQLFLGDGEVKQVRCMVGWSEKNMQIVECAAEVTKCETYNECCGDEFELTPEGNKVIVKRTDSDGGWGQVLQ